MSPLYLAWKDNTTKRWYPVGRLTQDDEGYSFVYVRGALEAADAGFQPFMSLPDLQHAYRSVTMFPLFANRVMPFTRADYPHYVEWLKLEGREKDPMAFLGRSGGRREADTLEVFPAPTPTDAGTYTVTFFVHGLRHMGDACADRVERLAKNETLLLGWDMQNAHDPDALTLRTPNPQSGDAVLIGFLPRYLSHEFSAQFRQHPENVRVTVEAVNLPPAPLEHRLLCRLNFSLPEGVAPFTSETFAPLA